MDDKVWTAAIAKIESLRFQLINSAGMGADERVMLRTNLCVVLRELARYVENEQRS